MNKEEGAAYQREYRKRLRGEPVNVDVNSVNKGVNVNSDVNSLRAANKELQAEVANLRAEVSRLKKELAQRPTGTPKIVVPKLTGGFVSPFSRQAQASGRAMPNMSPLGRMAE